MKDISAKDKRYTVTKQYCGDCVPKYVLRFCGEWIDCYKFKDTAIQARKEHAIRRDLILKGV